MNKLKKRCSAVWSLFRVLERKYDLTEFVENKGVKRQKLVGAHDHTHSHNMWAANIEIEWLPIQK